MKKPVLWFQPDVCKEHLAFPGTSEKPERYETVDIVLRENDFQYRNNGPANYHKLRRAHSAAYLDTLAKTSKMSRFKGMGHALFSPYLQWYTAPFGQSFEAAKYAAGAVCAGVKEVLTGNTKRVFCAVRPPGHHAGVMYGEGFCILNNVAIGALDAVEHGARVAIIDFDRHHGNGTEEIIAMANDERLLFVSSYQEGCKYAKEPTPKETSSKLVRVPLPHGSTPMEFFRLYDQFVFPALIVHQPDIILISAGFDLHRDDALRPKVQLDTHDYKILTWYITTAADNLGAGIVSVLEGGYTLESLHDCVSAHVQALTS
jgi:acetoin utilization deacetylase AcuC-like enzyme